MVSLALSSPLPGLVRERMGPAGVLMKVPGYHEYMNGYSCTHTHTLCITGLSLSILFTSDFVGNWQLRSQTSSVCLAMGFSGMPL